MKIAIYSGTFDPIHTGHVAFIEDVLASGAVDRVVLMSEASPRRKQNVTPIVYREKMIDLAIKDLENVELFIPKENVQHSVGQTGSQIYNKYGASNDYSLMMGVDVLEFVEQWGPDSSDQKGLSDLLKSMSFIVALRTEDDGELAVEIRDKLKLSMKMIPSRFAHISSSKIRDALKSGAKPKGLNTNVADYIKLNNLYGSA